MEKLAENKQHFVEVCFQHFIHNRKQKELRCPTTEECLSKPWYIERKIQLLPSKATFVNYGNTGKDRPKCKLEEALRPFMLMTIVFKNGSFTMT